MHCVEQPAGHRPGTFQSPPRCLLYKNPAPSLLQQSSLSHRHYSCPLFPPAPLQEQGWPPQLTAHSSPSFWTRILRQRPPSPKEQGWPPQLTAPRQRSAHSPQLTILPDQNLTTASIQPETNLGNSLCSLEQRGENIVPACPSTGAGMATTAHSPQLTILPDQNPTTASIQPETNLGNSLCSLEQRGENIEGGKDGVV